MTELLAGRRGALVGLVVLGLATVAVVLLTTPWRPLPTPPGGATPVDPARDFTAAQIARAEAFHRLLRPGSYAAAVLGLLVAGGFGLTPLGARLAGALARPFGGGWGWQVVLGSVALAALGQLVALPFGLYAETVLRRYGLSTQAWGSWAVDAAKGFTLGAGITAAVLAGLYAVVRAAPRTWWLWAAGGGAALVVAASYLFPVLVEPIFNRFAPMPAGELRTSLLALAERDGVPVRDVLVADASRRTTALNAYVSGFGATRRIVVYDTLLSTASPREVRLVVAHELGHARRDDVLHGTLAGALGVAAAACAAYLLLGWPWLLRRAGVSGPADGRSVALLLALAAAGSLLAIPLGALASRRIEARADVHALELTRDPAGFVAMERTLAVVNIADLDPGPVSYAIFATHPTGPERIALARDWSRLNDADLNDADLNDARRADGAGP
ncbi:MAG TPA: M48 family metallopeptidase [Mycobacteriales bacterium]|nr:M48 family metallopeptidase [Mycobacteriales bacterium]